jgi:cell division GTPase FtsZ
MKLVVIGFGQCGGRITDEFARLNKKARGQRGIEIITAAYAVDTDVADLSELHTIKAHHEHRILVGGEKMRGYGAAKLSELGAEIAREDGDKVLDAIRSSKRFFEADAFLLLAGAAGGIGSGAIPIMTKHTKERYVDKPVYSLIVLPFEHEEQAEERTLYNTAVCLKSIYSVADAVFLVDNQKYARKDFSLRSNIAKINELIVESFYDLLCAGEEKKARHIGARMLDAGDIIQTLSGWTAIGCGKSSLPLIKLPFELIRDFRKRGIETHKAIQAMDEAIGGLSIQCNASDSASALYLLSAPAREMKMELVKELGGYLRRIAPHAVIRHGDYPIGSPIMRVVLILSQLGDVEKVREYYSKSTVPSGGSD